MNALEKDIQKIINYISYDDFDLRIHDILLYLKKVDSLYIKNILIEDDELHLIKSQCAIDFLRIYSASYNKNSEILHLIEIKCDHYIYEYILIGPCITKNIQITEIELCNFIDVFHNKLEDRYGNTIPEYFSPVKG